MNKQTTEQVIAHALAIRGYGRFGNDFADHDTLVNDSDSQFYFHVREAWGRFIDANKDMVYRLASLDNSIARLQRVAADFIIGQENKWRQENA